MVMGMKTTTTVAILTSTTDTTTAKENLDFYESAEITGNPILDAMLLIKQQTN